MAQQECHGPMTTVTGINLQNKSVMREILPTVLDIVVSHKVFDSDESTEYDEIKRVEASDIRTGDSISTGAIIFGEMKVLDISPEMITLGYKGQSKRCVQGRNGRRISR